MNEKEIKDLLDKYALGQCTPDEETLLFGMFNTLADRMAVDVPLSTDEVQQLEHAQQNVWQNLNRSHPINRRKKSLYIPLLRYAATILVLVGLGWFSYFIWNKNNIPKTQIALDIQPGGNKATLTLANGKVINLNDTSSGQLATLSNSGVQITNNTANGLVTYKDQSSKTEGVYRNTESTGTNQITTPAGGQYQLVLPDGTRVFLNALSYLRFPSRFTDANQRNVSLVGEAYFEVAKDAKRPFFVTSEGQQIKVLGTHFNVSAYPGDSVKTTLAEGSVALLQPSTGLRQPLLPSQQSVLLPQGFTVRHVKIENEIAWIDDMFIFHQTSLVSVMKQICRWYNVEVDYSSFPATTVIDAELSRTLTLNEILAAIGTTSDHKLNFKLINGRRIMNVKK